MNDSSVVFTPVTEIKYDIMIFYGKHAFVSTGRTVLEKVGEQVVEMYCPGYDNVIDIQGCEVFGELGPEINEFTIYPEITEGMILVQNNQGKWGYFDLSGKQIIDFLYDDANCFYENVALVSRDNKFGLIDKNGKEINFAELDDARFYFGGASQSDYSLLLVKKDGFYGVRCGRTFEPILDTKFTRIDRMLLEPDNLICAQNYGSLEVYDTKGNLVKNLQKKLSQSVDSEERTREREDKLDFLDDKNRFNDKLLFIKHGGKNYLVDRCGNKTDIISQNLYDYAEEVAPGVCKVAIGSLYGLAKFEPLKTHY